MRIGVPKEIKVEEHRVGLTPESVRQLAARGHRVLVQAGASRRASRATTHADPVYVVDGILHYCVANMPGAVPSTSTYALNHATLPFVMALAERGVVGALRADPQLRNGLNVCRGAVTRREVAEALGTPYREALAALASA